MTQQRKERFPKCILFLALLFFSYATAGCSFDTGNGTDTEQQLTTFIQDFAREALAAFLM